MQTAAEQIWEKAKLIERQRVEAVQEEARRQGKKSSVVYEPSKVKQPWAWSRAGAGPLFDLGDELVSAVTEFDFDLNDEGFVDFLRQAFQLHICGKPGSEYWDLLNRKAVSREEFFATESMAYAQEHEGCRHQFTDDEMQGLWRIFERNRIYIQGAYDVYKQGAILWE